MVYSIRDMTYTCEFCKGTGWITVKKGDQEFVRKCQCQSSEAYLKRSEHANIPVKFQGYELKTFFPDTKFPSQKDVIVRVRRFIDDYPSVMDNRGLLFQGRAGVGKTHLMCTIANELIKKIPTLDIYYIDWNNLVQEMRSGDHFATRDFSDVNRLVERLASVDLLLFDELGASSIAKLSSWLTDSIYYIINKRYNNQKITICATNYPDKPKEGQETLTDQVGERIRSRLYEMTEIVMISGADQRRKV